MNRLLLAFLFLALGTASSFAACPATSAQMKDNAGSTFNMGQVSDSNGNCTSKVDIDTGSQFHTDMIAPVTLGSASAGMTKNYQNALSNTAVAIDAAAGQLYELFCYNPNSSAAFIQIWDTAQGSVTVGTTAPVLSYGIPATNSAGFAHSLVGIQFSTAITAAATTTSNGGVAPSTALNCNFVYK